MNLPQKSGMIPPFRIGRYRQTIQPRGRTPLDGYMSSVLRTGSTPADTMNMSGIMASTTAEIEVRRTPRTYARLR
jgi:hypothetical protein